ncbi:MAG: hypothetical protein P8Y03_27580 [Anaerolineales bacterium]
MDELDLMGDAEFRSSTRAPDSRRSAAPRVASFSGVIGLWMR